MIRALNHLTLAVGDLDRSFDFYAGVLGLTPVARWDGGAYLLAGGDWITLIADPAVRESRRPDYTHAAFTVSPEDFEGTSRRVLAAAPVWQENPTEGASLYFLDPDGHRLELHASGLASRLASDRRDPPPGMRFYRASVSGPDVGGRDTARPRDARRSVPMSRAGEIVAAHPRSAAVEAGVLEELISASFECEQVCTACADACLGEESVRELARCIRLDLDCAEVCAVTGRIASRQTAFEPELARPMIEACARACRLCGDECERHAGHHDHCRVCLEACRRCEEACNGVLRAL